MRPAPSTDGYNTPPGVPPLAGTKMAQQMDADDDGPT
jgi:hypothetical protein